MSYPNILKCPCNKISRSTDSPFSLMRSDFLFYAMEEGIWRICSEIEGNQIQSISIRQIKSSTIPAHEKALDIYGWIILFQNYPLRLWQFGWVEVFANQQWFLEDVEEEEEEEASLYAESALVLFNFSWGKQHGTQQSKSEVPPKCRFKQGMLHAAALQHWAIGWILSFFLAQFLFF